MNLLNFKFVAFVLLILAPFTAASTTIDDVLAAVNKLADEVDKIKTTIKLHDKTNKIMNDTIEERVNTLEAEMDIVQSTLIIVQDELNEAQDDIDLLETEDSLFDQRMIIVEGEIANNEDDIDELDTRINELDLTVTSHTSAIEDLEQRLNELEIAVNATWTACESSPCDNDATCVDVNVDTFICVCRDGFFGITCSETYEDTYFLATISADFVSPVPDPIVFDEVRSNPGGYYDNSTGIYTVPLDGTYEFDVQIGHGYDDDDFFGYDLVVDGADIAYSFHYDEDEGSLDYITVDSSIILALTSGQQVWVSPVGQLITLGSPDDEMWSWFSGRLISAA